MAERPRARIDGFESEEVGDDLLLYDNDRSVVCRLNRTAAVVWRACDGERTIDDLVTVVSGTLGYAADRDLVTVTLDRLSDNGLIASGYELRDPRDERMSRRRFMRRLVTAGAAAAVAFPLVESLITPAAASDWGRRQHEDEHREGQRESERGRHQRPPPTATQKPPPTPTPTPSDLRLKRNIETLRGRRG